MSKDEMSDWLAKKKERVKKGYAFIPGWLLLDERVSGEAKVTWQVIYKLMNPKKVEYPKINISLDVIAYIRNKSKRQIQRHLRELKKTGRVFVNQHRFNKPQTIIFEMIKDE